jgi:cysteine desulfurase
METVRAHCNKDLFAVSMMLVNNETGALYPVAEVFRMAKAANPDCICHCDAVQGFLKVPMTVKSLSADLITVSAHKIRGPKGVGALFVSQRLLSARALTPFYGGGGQEFGFRSGTENLIGIAGFAAACAVANANKMAFNAHTGALSEKLIASLASGEIKCNLPAKRAPHIVSITLPDIKSETMLHFLDSKGIAVSAGSACSSHAKAPSGTLLAFGLSAAEADSTLRISFSAENTESDVDALVSALQEGLEKLIRIHH